jgi:adenosylmethionine---8-amino-7-oxononanoate aminotransferase
MSDLIVLGTDTDAGKTSFCLLWLAAFADKYEYWKPVETGESDSQRVAGWVAEAIVHPALKHFSQPLAPPLAARLANEAVPSASAIAARRPQPKPGRSLLIETFGGPLSPLNERELQVELLKCLAGRMLLVSSSALGAIGRTLSCFQALAAHGLNPDGVVLLGPPDDFAADEIQKHAHVPVYRLQAPQAWTADGIRRASDAQREKLNEILSLCHSQTPLENPSTLIERDRLAIWHPYTSLQDPDPPLVCVEAKDEFLTLADGRKVIDTISSWWTILHGHRHPVLVKALKDAATTLDHVHFAGVTHAPAIELAELLLSTAPWQGGRVFYSDNGSTAVEVALKMAYQFWCHQGEARRTRFIAFEGGYHGDTFGAMAVSRDPVFFGRFEPLLFHADILPLSAERLDDALQRNRDTAAIILEPLVQGAGGMRMHSPDLLRQMSEVAKTHDVLFIADEVMTGGGRTGTLWAYQQAGIAPDLICAAKTLAGGMLPLAATLAAPRIVDAWQTDDPGRTFFHGHSFTAHPLACAVAVANWKMLTTEPLAAPARMEAFWKDALAPLRDRPNVRDVRVRGTIAAVELEAAGGYLADVGRRMRRSCLENGVLARPLGTVLYAMPPFCITPRSLDSVAAAMMQAVSAL